MVVKLTLRKSEWLDDWYVVELAEHDGRQFLEQVGPRAFALRCSARLSDADIEGTVEEASALATEIRAQLGKEADHG